MDIIEAEGLKKSYGETQAVKGISFRVERGSLFSFLGVNGAGKSTTINILCSILPKDEGRVTICGFDLDKRAQDIKRRVGVVFQKTVLDDKLTVRENLLTRASFYGMGGRAWKQRLEELDSMLSLADILDRPFGKLSGGQRRRADIARGLIHAPELLFLDEPTTGLDPQTRRTVWETVQRLRRETQMTVFLTTHYMEEADSSDRVMILDRGLIAADGSPQELKNKYSESSLKLYGDLPALRDKMQAAGIAAGEGENCLTVSCESAERARAFLAEHPDLCRDFEYVKGSMDDVFLNVTGRSLQGV